MADRNLMLAAAEVNDCDACLGRRRAPGAEDADILLFVAGGRPAGAVAAAALDPAVAGAVPVQSTW